MTQQLQSLTLHNFQKHGDLTIKLDPLVTVLCGPSDCGKSSIMRALRWLCVNRPSGAAFQKHGEDQVKVSAKLGGITITRERSGSNNLYQLDKQQYKSFGQDVPDTVAGSLKVSEINFQMQHDPPFWFSLTGSQVSQELNRIVNLSLIDRTIDNLSSKLRKSQTVVDILDKRLQEANEEKESLAWVPLADAELAEIEEEEVEVERKRVATKLLRNLIEQLGEAESNIMGAKERIGDLVDLSKEASHWKKQSKKAQELYSLVKQAREGEEQLCHLEKKRTAAESALQKAKSDRCPLCGKSQTT